MPLNNREKPAGAAILSTIPQPRWNPALTTLIPDNPNTPYDMKELILKIADEGDLSTSCTGKNFAKKHASPVSSPVLEVAPVGVGPANQPNGSGGLSGYRFPSRKGARLRSTGVYNTKDTSAFAMRSKFRFVEPDTPLTLVDVPGFLAGDKGQEYCRRHQAWREAALRLWRSDGAESDRDYPQGLWRRLCGDGIEALEIGTSTTHGPPQRLP